ncbi:hypothetical protein C9374_009794 [Naegleria lovaniensis]|uniref:Tr-type G domain-containing protein n=1 Tax=Naegleria lovaniensis TaxID=51637 RepID=A0AA88KRG4_NAELO|nr:uncharacterized protein C9374_009794 [Naegleria lovaniensis]KAG2393217.1 hypothetical protein C9374_009794 [Naegleria lovaniensis]
MYQSSDEFQSDYTIHVNAKHVIQTNTNVQFRIIDIPSRCYSMNECHRGIFMGSIGILVVNAESFDFEWQVSATLNPIMQVMMAKWYGMKQLIVCVNRMDIFQQTKYSEEKFHEIHTRISKDLKKIGFEETIIIPISAMYGYNVTERSVAQFLSWYSGKCLLEVLNEQGMKFQSEKALQKHCATQPLFDDYKFTNISTIHSPLKIPKKLSFWDLLSIQIFNKDCQKAYTNDIVGICLSSPILEDNHLTIVEHKNVATKSGFIISDPNFEPCCFIKSFEAHAKIVKSIEIRKIGRVFLVYYGFSRIPCRVEKVFRVITKNGQSCSNNSLHTIVLEKGAVVIFKFIPQAKMLANDPKNETKLSRILLLNDDREVVSFAKITNVERTNDERNDLLKRLEELLFHNKSTPIAWSFQDVTIQSFH